MRYGRWEIVLFLFGMLMAEMDLINGTWEPSARQVKPETTVMRTGATKRDVPMMTMNRISEERNSRGIVHI
jgi:hypothetical protein